MKHKKHKAVIAVIGGRTENTTEQGIALAERVGRELALRDIAVICGGGDGIMEAVCRGCKKAGGTTFGVMKGNNAGDANAYIDYPIITSMDLARNHIIVWTGNGVIAFDGMYGTLEETALTLDIAKPLLIMGDRPLIDTSKVELPFFHHFKGYDPGRVPEAIDILCSMIDNYIPEHANILAHEI